MTNEKPSSNSSVKCDAAPEPTRPSADVQHQAGAESAEKTYTIPEAVADAMSTFSHYLRWYGVYSIFVDASAGESAEAVHLALLDVEHWLADHGLPYTASLPDNERCGSTDQDLRHPYTVCPMRMNSRRGSRGSIAGTSSIGC